MTTLSDVKKHPQIQQFIEQTERALAELSYTDHGSRHSNLVANIARSIAKEIGLSDREGELAAIAGYCHDMGNFLGRNYHNYLGALLFQHVFRDEFDPKELVIIMQAISNHDERKKEIAFIHPVSAVVVLADKSDVHRSRVAQNGMDEIKADIHDRVNYATQSSDLKIDKKKKRVNLVLKIDTKFVPVMEYFEIFTDRMVFCRKAAKYLGYDFGLVINDFELL